MGIGPNKSKILKILEKSVTYPNINEQRNLKLEYYKLNDNNDNDDNYDNDYLDNDSFNFTVEEIQSITDFLGDVKNLKEFPYITVGTISVKFPLDDKKYEYTCFVIDLNIIVTLESNLIDKNKGGKAEYITSSFSQEKIDWKNIFTQNDYNEKKYHQKLESKSEFSNLAVIIYEKNICNEYFGVEGRRWSRCRP